MICLLELPQAERGHCACLWGPDHLALCQRWGLGPLTVAEIRARSRRRLKPHPVDVRGAHCHEGWVEIPGISSSVGDTVVTWRNELNKQVKKGWGQKSANPWLWSEIQAGAGTRLCLTTPLWLLATWGWHWGYPSWKCIAFGPVHMSFGYLLPSGQWCWGRCSRIYW